MAPHGLCHGVFRWGYGAEHCTAFHYPGTSGRPGAISALPIQIPELPDSPALTPGSPARHSRDRIQVPPGGLV